MARPLGSRPFTSSSSSGSLASSSWPGRGGEVIIPKDGVEVLDWLRATSCSRDLSSMPIFSLRSAILAWPAGSRAGAMKRQSRENLVQLEHGCCLSHLSFLRRHSRHEVMRRLRRRIRGCSLCGFFSAVAPGEARLEVPWGGDGVENSSAIAGDG